MGHTKSYFWFHFETTIYVKNENQYRIFNIINERNEYLLSTLTQASDLLNEANSITETYESDLQTKRKEVQADLANSEKIYQQVWELELQMIQKETNIMLQIQDYTRIMFCI